MPPLLRPVRAKTVKMGGIRMTDNSIQAFQPSGGALSAEHYQTFELAKENDSVLGGDNIAQIRSYAAYARAQAQAIHKTIAATNGIDDVAAIKSEVAETAQTYAKVGIYADQRIGEILRELPKSHGNQYQQSATVGTPTKAEAEKQAGISHATAYDLQALAANPDVVQAVLDKAEAEGRIPSRKQVLDAIKERDDARETVSMVKKVGDTLKKQRDNAQAELARAQEEIAALEKQNDELYDRANAAQQPQVIERVVESEATKKRISDLEHEVRVVNETHQRLRKQLEDTRQQLQQANDLLGESDRTSNARRDIEQLTIATNSYLRNYGGRAWAFDQFDRVDETTQTEFIKAINNLAAFAQNLAQMIQDKKQLGVNND